MPLFMQLVMSVKKIKSYLRQKTRRSYYAFTIRLLEKTYKNGVKYIFKNNRSDKLLIVFSGIGSDYNYRRSLKDSSWDQLYIKDSWAKGISYYLYENGSNYPEKLTSDFINVFLSSRPYSKIVSLGSSKGGSAALYYGIKHKFDEVFCGACQYKVGNYVAIFHKDDGYYPLLMGTIPQEEGIKILNDKYGNLLKENYNSSTMVKLVYSTEEHTYEDDIVPLLRKLDECHIMHEDQIEDFPQHSMIGNYMKEICKVRFK